MDLPTHTPHTQVAHRINVRLLLVYTSESRYLRVFHCMHLNTTTKCIIAHLGVLRVGRMVNLLFIKFKRKRVGPKYQGTILFINMLQHNVAPERIDNFYACEASSETTARYVRVQDLCTLLAEVNPRTVSPNMVNLVPIAHAFPVSWVVS